MVWYKYVTVEVPLLMATFAMVIQMAISTNIFMYRACYVILEYDKDQCSQLGNEDNNVTKYLEPLVQPTVNRISMVESTVRSTIPLLFCMYVGTWSDKFGRKPFMIICFFGIVLSSLLSALIAHFENLSPWWFLIANVPSLVTGGFSTNLLVISAYLADITTPKQRAVRLATFEVIFALSSFIGNLMSSYLLYATSYEVIYFISFGMVTIGLLYIIFVIPESLKEKEKVPKLTEVFKYVNISDIIKDAFKKRENNARPYVLLILGVSIFCNFPMGEMSIMTLFLRNKFHWTLTRITVTTSVTSVGNIVATIIGMTVLYKMLKIKELPIALLSTLTSIAASVLRAIATNDILIFAAYGVAAFRGLVNIMLRTMLSYLVPPDEMGKLFAVNTITQSLVDTVSSLAYTNLYNATLTTNSALFNYMTAGDNIIVAICILFMMKLKFPFNHEFQKDPEGGPEEETVAQKRNSIRMSLEVMDTRNLSLR